MVNCTVSFEINALLQRGRAFHQNGRLGEARAIYQSVLTQQPNNLDALNLLGVIAAQEGDLEQAAEWMGQALQIVPDRAPLHFNRGAVLQQLKRTEEAVDSFQCAIDIEPEFAEAHFNLGLALRSLNRAEEAIRSFERAVSIQPAFGEAHLHLGDVFQECKRTAQALASYDRAIALMPDLAESHFNRGVVLHELKRMEEALASYDRALAIEPNYAAAYSNRGIALHVLRRSEEALASFDRAIEIKPDDATAYCNRGIALHWLRRSEEALVSYDRAIAIQRDYAAAYSNRGIALHRLKRSEEALASFDRAIDIDPDYATAYSNRGIALDDLKRTEDALESYDRAIAINPDFAEPFWNKSLAFLGLGNFDEGWRLYEWRWKRTNGITFDARYHHVQPPWLGNQALAGKTILLHAEQGLGDTIQFCRYARLVKAMGATVILEVPRQLANLLHGLDGVDRVIEQGYAPPSFDFHCPLMSLPLACKTRMDTIPSSARYLHASPQDIQLWQQRLGKVTRPRVGLVWSGGFRPEQPELWAVNERRNLPLELLGMLKGVDIYFISLQKGEPAESEFATAMSAGWVGPQIANFSAELQDFTDTAALIENLDLVISVDTSVAHLAAALGKPVWILNRFDSCWRWLQDRTDSPWYPTVKLYNQVRAGDWEEVMHRVRQDLIAFTR